MFEQKTKSELYRLVRFVFAFIPELMEEKKIISLFDYTTFPPNIFTRVISAQFLFSIQTFPMFRIFNLFPTHLVQMSCNVVKYIQCVALMVYYLIVDGSFSNFEFLSRSAMDKAFFIT